ncbi:hypothetical protein GCWU000341_01206 [Oribacterium sp. oral taxon 078 str. F0262]|uniref:ABC transporter permease n=1 Tax=Oribacterium sp. oral taxon 078 TaxID=652706 RepID=UPI0001BCBEBA|nr:ABC transporter permease [Oribacterium sp. oral taxon 078]EFE92019.1 hypothetical protein GCWU000341_01206 [Oribacterium sp. oral taxon 078 str. F0262]
MRSLLCALYKDLRLFHRGGGWLSLLLPLFLLPLMLLLLRPSDFTVQPFPVAVKDEDRSFMSRSLIEQLRELPLFSEIRVIPEGETEERALSEGAAAAVTIPKDFFYSAYRYRGEPVKLSLNSSRPEEAAIFGELFRSVMGIMETEQAVSESVYALSFPGQLSEEKKEEMYESSSKLLLRAVLRRGLIFDERPERKELSRALLIRILSAVLFFLAFLLPLSILRSEAEERRMGVLPRFLLSGGSRSAFFLSKLLLSLFLFLPSCLILLLPLHSLGMQEPALFLLFSVLELFSSFLFLSGLTMLFSGGRPLLLLGNLFLAGSLLLGGSFLDPASLPPLLRSLSDFTPLRGNLLFLRLLSKGSSPSLLLLSSLPLLLLSFCGILFLFISAFKKRFFPSLSFSSISLHMASRGEKSGEPASAFPEGEGRMCFFRRLTRLSFLRAMALSGRRGGILLLLLSSLLLGALLSSFPGGGAKRIRIAAVDLDQSEASSLLLSELSSSDSLFTLETTEKEARRLLSLGELEGVLFIKRGYAEGLKEGEKSLLHYESAENSLSSASVRETISGLSISEGILESAKSRAEGLLGRELRKEEEKALSLSIRKRREEKRLYFESEQKGQSGEELLMPGREGFLALYLLLLSFSISGGLFEGGGRASERRMRSMERGVELDLLSAFFGILFLLTISFLPFLPFCRIGIRGTALLFLYSASLSSLLLLLSSFLRTERGAEGNAALLSLLFSLLGGCFSGLSLLPPLLNVPGFLLPPGLFLRALSGRKAAVLLLFLLSLLFLFLGYLGKCRPIEDNNKRNHL